MSDKAVRQELNLPWLDTIKGKVIDKSSTVVCDMTGSFYGEKRRKAAFIVKACNNHYKLVEALEALLTDLKTTLELSYGDEDDWESEDPEVYALVLKARQALAEVKGE